MQEVTNYYDHIVCKGINDKHRDNYYDDHAKMNYMQKVIVQCSQSYCILRYLLS